VLEQTPFLKIDLALVYVKMLEHLENTVFEQTPFFNAIFLEFFIF
jgi:hypothetical protein